MKRGTVTINNDERVRVEFRDGSYVECRKGEHKYEYFPVGEKVTCGPDAIYKDATTGHTFLPVDWREPFPEWKDEENAFGDY